MGTAVTAYVPPGQSRIVRLPAAPAASAAARVVLRGDDDDFDNTLHVIPPVRRTAQVLWFGREGLEDPKGAGYFLRRALSDTPALAVQVESGGLEVPVGRARPDLAVVSGVLSESAVSTVRDWLSSGATVLAVADNTECGSTLARLAGQNEVRLTEANVEGYAMLGEIDFRHPLFSAFADPRFNDFTKIRFWRHRVIDPTSLGAARVLARFDRGSPAVLEVTVGQGRLYVLTAGWTPADSQLALSSKFVPLLWSLLEIAGARADAPAQLSVGDTLPLTKGHGGGVLSGPTATTRAVAVDAPVLGPFMEPGVYEWTSGGRTERFAVNLDPAESRTSPLNREQLEERGLPLASATDTSSRPKAEAERLADPIIEARQKIWRWALVAALLALALEMALAGRTTRIDFEKEISRA
jgi:hypothetical protein